MIGDGTANHLFGPGVRLAEQGSGSAAPSGHANHLGSVRKLTDSSGTMAPSQSYLYPT